jgi:hypothetical protein
MQSSRQTFNRIESENELSKSAPKSALVTLPRSLFWQHLPAKRSNAVGISSGPSVSSKTLNSLGLVGLKDVTYERRRCFGMKSKLLTKAAIIGVVSISVWPPDALANIGITDLIV